jgi:molybdopterin converting factor subunit 1
MRRVKVLYFAAVRDLVGKGEEDIDLPESVRALQDFVAELLRLHPELEGRLGAVRFAVNESFADLHERISPGDVVALIPPVAGG